VFKEEVFEDILVDLVLLQMHVLAVLDGLEAELHEGVEV
jgi:hypothetical protein